MHLGMNRKILEFDDDTVILGSYQKRLTDNQVREIKQIRLQVNKYGTK